MLRKATEAEKTEYAATRPVYPLWGFSSVSGHTVVIEDCSRYAQPGEPRYEAVAPSGHIFGFNGTHYLLASSQALLRSDLANETLERCECKKAGCADYWIAEGR